MDRRQFTAGAALGVVAAAMPDVRAAWAQAAYPNRPITLLVAHGAGSSTDVVARLAAQEIGTGLGQPIVVEPKPGAGGNIATVSVKRAPPDGHVLLANSVAIAVNPSLYQDAGYDPVRELTAVAMGPRTPNLITVNPQLPIRSLADLLDYVRRTPSSYASSGTGTTTHLSMERLKKAAGVDITHIPYLPARAVTDVVGGHVPIGSTSLPVAVPLVRGGQLRAIAVTSRVRSPALPDVPTLAELGHPAFDDHTWFGFFAPAGLPTDVLERLNGAINRALTTPTAATRLAELGFELAPLSPQAFAAFVAAETAKWREVVVTNGIKAEG